MRLALLLILSLVATDCLAFTMGDAINISGRQRMLSQRIAQTYLLKAIQPDVAHHQKRLDRAVNEFQRNLTTLQAFEEAQSLQPQLRLVANLWQDYKILAQAPVSKESAEKLLMLSNQVLTEAHTYVQQLQTLANHSSAELVNISGRQRMLSQRIAKNYLAYYWEINKEGSLSNLFADLEEFQNKLEYLMASPYNTGEINQKLEKTMGHFEYASKGFDGEMRIQGKRLVDVTIGTTDTMLYNMDGITKLYAAVLDAEQNK
ncbi:type IV pili methyl-accepting chemotaxis transducer N-terminal domain-containing protein [Saccharophagus degradans]|uniref:Type IV pili methyl-accepting chemotaxis transducer N-terminal domain-containing protein n=1 Tax=Saccharophagus degradans TaxID=86304 RepID=A0AAW7X2Y6_9GAMM|nr:type IV pili methyl-accepting chemotaxis transducer N-terminal domain-containing protein [Saccharophagus degradans]MDO6421907.1 type IV pili methyl-accepting chemotaxis transducer N-terminal domain-containing protein [Saccharophagus degradans]MDO6606400.1 type IV pili methyl-accepting chemotaxis transducer N-terminal domain-containing protein [Saccharophagus degradans]